MPSEIIALSKPVGDTVKTTTCYMCACRCGIRVHLEDGRLRYIEGNPDHPVNHGVLCGQLGRHHAALFAGPAAGAAAPGR